MHAPILADMRVSCPFFRRVRVSDVWNNPAHQRKRNPKATGTLQCGDTRSATGVIWPAPKGRETAEQGREGGDAQVGRGHREVQNGRDPFVSSAAMAGTGGSNPGKVL